MNFASIRRGLLCASTPLTLALASGLALSLPFSAARAQSAASASTSDIGSQVRFNVEKYKLPNGLTVLLYVDHTVPMISYQTWFRVGSKNEEPGLTGMAHLFEHMMFKGAKRYSGEDFDKILQANGAVNNAFTTHDYTGYYENLPSSKLELVMDIESDRMENLVISAEKLKSERDVVKEERRFRVDNNPTGLLREAIFATAFKVAPYRWPVIGHMADLDNVTVENATQFYRTYYAPNNAVIVVAGDFNKDEAKRLIQKYYGNMKSQPLPNKALPVEPVQTGPRVQVLERDVQTTQFAFVYHTPKSGDDDTYALDLLANIMGNGVSSRLYQRLVYKEQSALSTGSYNMSLEQGGLFQVSVTLKPGASYAQAQKAVLGEMWRPRNLLVKPDELQKAKNQLMKSYVDALKTVHGKAEALALNEVVFSDYERLFKDLEHYNKVTPEQVRKVAKKYLIPERSTLVILKPKPKAKEQKPAGRGGQ